MGNIDYSTDRGVAEITITRPDVMNAIDSQTIEQLADCLNTAIDDNGIYSIILTGAGRAFCSGGDLNEIQETSDKLKTHLKSRKMIYVMDIIHNGNLPVIAAMNGPAVGAGADLALASDLRLMSEKAFIRPQFVDIGLIPGDGGGWFLPKLVGESRAKEIFLLGKDIHPEEAAEMGLVHRVSEREDLMVDARSMAKTIRDKPAVGVRKTKSLINDPKSFEEYAEMAVEFRWECANDPEHKEAIRAMREGRDPEFAREY